MLDRTLTTPSLIRFPRFILYWLWGRFS